MVLAIDPGANTGWALFVAGRLEWAGLGIDKVFDVQSIARPSRIVCELPIIVRGQQAPPSSIITLALRAGEAVGKCRSRWSDASVEYVQASVWKGGSIPKDVSHARIHARLSPYEIGILTVVRSLNGKRGKPMANGLWENVLDAVGIGLYAVGRQA